MSASPIDLTTLEDVRRFLQKQDMHTDQDDIIEQLITAASRAIAEYTEREFTDTGTATRRFLVDQCDGILDFAPYDLRASDSYSLVLDPQDTGGTALTEWSDYILKPQPAKWGIYSYATLLEPLPVVAQARRGSQRAVSVTGTWGFSGIPQDVVHWTNVVVATWLRKDIAAFTNVFNLDEGRVERAAALPGGAIAALRPYKRGI